MPPRRRRTRWRVVGKEFDCSLTVRRRKRRRRVAEGRGRKWPNRSGGRRTVGVADAPRKTMRTSRASSALAPPNSAVADTAAAAASSSESTPPTPNSVSPPRGPPRPVPPRPTDASSNNPLSPPRQSSQWKLPSIEHERHPPCEGRRASARSGSDRAWLVRWEGDGVPGERHCW